MAIGRLCRQPESIRNVGSGGFMAGFSDESRETKQVQLLTSHQLDLFLYVRSLVLDPHVVAEIVQETNLVLWQRREEFELIRDFRAWAFQIARNKLLQYRDQSKRKCVSFSDALIDELAVHAPRHASVDADLIGGLHQCVDRLTAKDRELLSKRYSSQETCESIAKSVGRPVTWVYNAMRRIRHELLDCMKQHHPNPTRREV
jgi:RNA polymerase sigma-70 factor (ECF subfamily)